jgi:RNA polymerase sigma-70 factor (ECF subfamily)
MVVRMEREGRTDAELLRRSRRDPDAFVLVCRRHAAALDGWLTVQVRDAGLARELLAETFSEAWFSRGRFSDPGDGDARPWLFGIARNLVRRVYRDRAVASRGRARLGLPVSAPDEYGEVLDRLAAGQTLGSFDEQLAGLPESQRDALELRVVDELDYEEIGERLAITPEGARTRVFRALATLRAQIGRSA